MLSSPNPRIYEGLGFLVANPRTSEPFFALKHSRCGPFYVRSEFVFALTLSGTQNRDLEGGEEERIRFSILERRLPKIFFQHLGEFRLGYKIFD